MTDNLHFYLNIFSHPISSGNDKDKFHLVRKPHGETLKNSEHIENSDATVYSPA
jgi:hypothetical protein